MMFQVSEFTGRNSLASVWTDALFCKEFECLMQQAEKSTSKQEIQKHVSPILTFLASIPISKIAIRAERDLKTLEKVCHGFYKDHIYPSDYHATAYRRLTIANFPYTDKELCIYIGVSYLSPHFRIWACKRFLNEIQRQYSYVHK